MSLTALLIYCVVQGSLSAAYTPEKPSTNTTFSLPIQQVAKIAVSCDLNEEEQEKIDWIFPGGAKYYPGLSDPAKGAVSMETDEEWQQMLRDGKAPDLPEWIRPYFLQQPPSVDETLFYSSGC